MILSKEDGAIFMIIIFHIYGVCPYSICGRGYIFREEAARCCEIAVCPEDFFLIPCSSNYGKDACMRCPDGYHLPDVTNSSFFVECTAYNCPKETVPSRIKSHDGCSLYCKCNLEAGYCGNDPCACHKPRVQCPYGTTRVHNCGCDPVNKVTPTPTFAESKITPGIESPTETIVQNTNISAVTTPSSSAVQNTSRTLPGTTTSAEEMINSTEDEPWLHALIASVTSVCGFIILVILVALLIFHCYRRKSKDQNAPVVQYHHTTYNDNRTNNEIQILNTYNNRTRNKIKNIYQSRHRTVGTSYHITGSSNVAVGDRAAFNYLNTGNEFEMLPNSDGEGKDSGKDDQKNVSEALLNYERDNRQNTVAHPEGEQSEQEDDSPLIAHQTNVVEDTGVKSLK